MEMLRIGGFRCNFRGSRKGNSLPNDFEKFWKITQKKLAPLLVVASLVEVASE